MLFTRFRFAFLVAVAVVAAAIGDPLVESVSNSGLFGRGFNDNNHLSVVPAFVGGALLLLIAIAVRCRPLFAGVSSLRCWHSASAQERPSGLRRSDVPLVFALQLATLFTMESVEQLVFNGKLLGGTVWLGGPAGFSLPVHALVGGSCLVLFAAFVRWICAAVASLVCEAVQAILFSLARGAARGFEKLRHDALPLRAQAPHARQIGGRAPPHRLLAA